MTKKRSQIDVELHLLYKYGLDRFRTLRDKVLPEHMTEFLELEDNEDNFDEYGN